MQRIRNFLFKNTSNHQIVAKNTIWLGIGEIGSRLFKLGVFVQAARILGVSEWGVFSYGLALIGVFSIFSDIGMNSILQREVAKNSLERQRYISTGFFIKAILSIISALLLWGTSLFSTTSTTTSLIPLIALMLLIDSVREFGFALNRASERMETEAIIKLLSNALLALIAFLTISHAPTASSLMIAYIVAGILSLILLFLSVRNYFTRLLKSFDRRLVRQILIEAWPIGIVAVFGTILSSIDTVILGWFRTTTDVGYYAASQKPLQLLWLVPGLLSTAILPFFSKHADGDEVAFSSVLGRAITLSFGVMLPLSIGCIIFAGPIITILFGSNYSPAIILLQITTISALATIPSIFLSNALLAHGKQKLTLWFIALGACSNVTLSLILIPKYGMYGAAISYTLSQIIANTFMVRQTRRIPALHFHISLSSLARDIRKFLNY